MRITLAVLFGLCATAWSEEAPLEDPDQAVMVFRAAERNRAWQEWWDRIATSTQTELIRRAREELDRAREGDEDAEFFLMSRTGLSKSGVRKLSGRQFLQCWFKSTPPSFDRNVDFSNVEIRFPTRVTASVTIDEVQYDLVLEERRWRVLRPIRIEPQTDLMLLPENVVAAWLDAVARRNGDGILEYSSRRSVRSSVQRIVDEVKRSKALVPATVLNSILRINHAWALGIGAQDVRLDNSWKPKVTLEAQDSVTLEDPDGKVKLVLKIDECRWKVAEDSLGLLELKSFSK